jgi:hypothetical protein
MKNQKLVYGVLVVGAILVLYLSNKNKKLTQKSEAFFCDKNTHFYDYSKKKCQTYEEAFGKYNIKT